MPFYGQAGIILNGTQVSSLVISGNGAVVSGGSVEINGFNVTDGMTTINNPTVLNLSGSAQQLSASRSPAQIVWTKAQTFTSSGNDRFDFGKVTSAGNILLFFYSSSQGSYMPAPLGWSVFAGSSPNAGAYYKTSTGDSYTNFSGQNGQNTSISFVEVEGGNGNTMSLSSSSVTVAGGTFTASASPSVPVSGLLISSVWTFNAGDADNVSISGISGASILNQSTSHSTMCSALSSTGAGAQVNISGTMTGNQNYKGAFMLIVSPSASNPASATLEIT